jgi:hypothetical protein
MARGRKKGSKIMKAVRLSDLKNFLPEGAVVQVSLKWLQQVESIYNVRFLDPEKPEDVYLPDPEELESVDEKEAEVRERIEIAPEEL